MMPLTFVEIYTLLSVTLLGGFAMGLLTGYKLGQERE